MDVSNDLNINQDKEFSVFIISAFFVQLLFCTIWLKSGGSKFGWQMDLQHSIPPPLPNRVF